MKRILIIEDNPDTLEDLKYEFENVDFNTICCADYDSVQKVLENNVPFDAVILDWFFVLPQSSDYSKSILRKLKDKCFVPVFVYTGHLTDFNAQSEEELGYPKNMITGFDKSIGETELNNQLQNLLENNFAYKLAIAYREKLKLHLEKVFFELNDSENSDLGKVFKIIYGDGENIDWNNDIIITLLHRSLISDDSFTNSISEISRLIPKVHTTNNEFNRKIISKILYHYGKSNYIRNGDIVSLEKLDGTIMNYGVVVTPDCDLEQYKTQFIDIIELADIEDEKLALNQGQKNNIKSYNHGSFFLFPAINIEGTLKDFIAILKSRFILKEKDIAENTKYPNASKRPLYSHTFIYNGLDLKLRLICSKVNPYKAEFLHKLHTHDSRVGIPDIKRLL